MIVDIREEVSDEPLSSVIYSNTGIIEHDIEIDRANKEFTIGGSVASSIDMDIGESVVQFKDLSNLIKALQLIEKTLQSEAQTGGNS